MNVGAELGDTVSLRGRRAWCSHLLNGETEQGDRSGMDLY